MHRCATATNTTGTVVVTRAHAAVAPAAWQTTAAAATYAHAAKRTMKRTARHRGIATT